MSIDSVVTITFHKSFPRELLVKLANNEAIPVEDRQALTSFALEVAQGYSFPPLDKEGCTGENTVTFLRQCPEAVSGALLADIAREKEQDLLRDRLSAFSYAIEVRLGWKYLSYQSRGLTIQGAKETSERRSRELVRLLGFVGLDTDGLSVQNGSMDKKRAGEIVDFLRGTDAQARLLVNIEQFEQSGINPIT